MDKQQAIEAQTDKISWNDFSDLAQMVYVQALVKDATIAGWEAHEAQCPGDAVEFAKWMEKNGVYIDSCGEWMMPQNKHAFTVPELYKLFNPSGAAPQAIKLPDEFYNCLPQGYEFVNEEPVISNHYDAEENEIKGQCVVVMIMAGEGNIWTPTPRQVLPYGMLKAVYEGAGEWEDRCRSAENALIALVNMKQWKDRSGKDFIYTRQMPIAWAEANSHLATYYEEYEKGKPFPPAPQPAGPVWVKESNRVPDHYRNVHIRYNILHLGTSVQSSTTVRYNVTVGKWIKQDGRHLEGYTNLEWLDETSAPQVFTREQVSDAFHAGLISGLDSAQDRPFISQDEYMNINYPTK